MTGPCCPVDLLRQFAERHLAAIQKTRSAQAKIPVYGNEAVRRSAHLDGMQSAYENILAAIDEIDSMMDENRCVGKIHE